MWRNVDKDKEFKYSKLIGVPWCWLSLIPCMKAVQRAKAALMAAGLAGREMLGDAEVNTHPKTQHLSETCTGARRLPRLSVLAAW